MTSDSSFVSSRIRLVKLSRDRNLLGDPSVRFQAHLLFVNEETLPTGHWVGANDRMDCLKCLANVFWIATRTLVELISSPGHNLGESKVHSVITVRENLRVRENLELVRVVKSSEALEVLGKGGTQPVICLIAAGPEGVSAVIRQSMDLQDGKIGRYGFESYTEQSARLIRCGAACQQNEPTRNAILWMQAERCRDRFHIPSSCKVR